MSPSVTRSDTDPSRYPVVKIGDEEFELRYRHRDIMQLKKRGINLGARLEGSEIIEHLPAIIAAGLSHLGPLAPSLKKIEEYIGDLDYGELNLYTLAFVEAQKKASPEATAAGAKLRQLGKEAKRELQDLEPDKPEPTPTIN
jgi:hypothetical protein